VKGLPSHPLLRSSRRDTPSFRASDGNGARTDKTLQDTAGIVVIGPALVFGQQAKLGTPPSVITTPGRQRGRGAAPEIYPDPDIIVIDDSFVPY
jgi:hypothetical protein